MHVKENVLVENMRVFMAKFYKDRPLKNEMEIPAWLIPIQAGAALTEERVADILDNNGENISHKNPNYCELTVLYWMWKNCILSTDDMDIRYFGLFHYRRWLDIKDDDIKHIVDNDIDVILPYPTMHEPDIREHHMRYIKESDWDAVLQALKEISRECYASCEMIFSQEYLYNYNILVARTEVLKSYCEWLFPILERIEELSVPKGNERADRYIGYIGENLLTVYFMYHKRDLNIVHTGKIMLT